MLLVENNLHIHTDYTLFSQIRKLEFLLADALHKECKHVITCGGIQSNHCRITALAARELGLTPHLVLRGDVQVSEQGREKDKKYNVKNTVKHAFNEVVGRNDFASNYV